MVLRTQLNSFNINPLTDPPTHHLLDIVKKTFLMASGDLYFVIFYIGGIILWPLLSHYSHY